VTEMNEILSAGREQLGMSPLDLWTAYIGLGGLANFQRVESYLSGASIPGAADYDLLAQALNDEFIGRDVEGQMPYFEDLDHHITKKSLLQE